MAQQVWKEAISGEKSPCAKFHNQQGAVGAVVAGCLALNSAPDGS